MTHQTTDPSPQQEQEQELELEQKRTLELELELELEQEESVATIDAILHMPELAYALQRYLEPKHLVTACLVSKPWSRVWTPFLWQTLTLTQPHPVFRAHTPRSTSSFAVSPAQYHQDERYVLSVECLSRFGHHVRRLNASWLTSHALLRLSIHCVNLQQVKLAETAIPIRVLQPMLRALTRLRRLELDLPFEELVEDEKDEEDADPQPDAIINSSDDSALLRTIETCASKRLEHLELIFQRSVRMPVKALCSVLSSHSALHTVKLVDADIEDPKKKGGKSKRNKKKKNNRTRSGTASWLSTSGSSSSVSSTSTSVSSTLTTSASSSASEGEDESSSAPTPVTTMAIATAEEPFSLIFLSITSSHTSNACLGYILGRCHHLTALHLHSCDTITDDALEGIARSLRSLTSISLSSCKQLTSTGLNNFFKSTHQLVAHVHLCDLAALHDETLEIVALRHAHSLRKLAIYFCAFVTDKGIKAVLTACHELRVLGLQAYGMTPTIFEEPWACRWTLEQLDLQGVFKMAVDSPASGDGDSNWNTTMGGSNSGSNSNSNSNTSNISSNVSMGDFSATRVWRDRQARIDAFEKTRLRLITLSNLKNLRLSAAGIGKEVLEGFGQHQRIEVLHLYGLQSTQVDTLPWTEIRTRYPFLRQVYCGVIGVLTKGIQDKLARLHVELLASSSIPDLAFENNFDD
ncbi:hypothetical protein BC939DRAFT_195758 [Gamsiella multidivaricata]|uniref:uncharacterized protein n=1 Tax=Gamsiella multidivaricata TaxID=101098 RepID=UPI0022208994|nr:uncharacterized protein BC939DRAFT_195758 [Gamsiella multidivaricata]KAI7822013.1 hypothetical protein BC939DRAFT_195758 [Gamsiella multidivaricata]